jgi:hypothetical protein
MSLYTISINRVKPAWDDVPSEEQHAHIESVQETLDKMGPNKSKTLLVCSSLSPGVFYMHVGEFPSMDAFKEGQIIWKKKNSRYLDTELYVGVSDDELKVTKERYGI